MKKKLFIGAFIACSLTAMAAEEEFFFEDGTVTQRLEESVITTTGFENNVRNTPKNISIVTSEDIESKGAKDIGDALEGVPGVRVSRKFGGIQIDLRGQGEANHSNTLILIDGIKQNPVDMGGARLSGLSVENVERIEIIPGGGAVLYGDGAVGGIVNIITKTNASNEGNKVVYSEVGNNGRFRYGAGYGDMITDKLFLQLNYEDSNYDGYRDNGDKDTENIETALRYLINDTDSIGFKYARYTEDYGMPGSLTRDQVNDDRQQTDFPDNKADYKRDSYTLSYKNRLADGIDFSVDGNYTEADYDSYGKSSWGTDSRTAYDLEEMSIKPKLKFTYLEDSNIIFGYDYYRGKSENNYYYGSKVNRDLEKESHAVFAMNTYNWNSFQFTQGFRYEKTKYDLDANGETDWMGNPVEYKDDTLRNHAIDLGVNYFYSDTGSIYATYTKGFRTPNTDELALADSDLEEQTHEYFEIGVKDVIWNSYVSASIFKFTAEDEIYYDSGANGGNGANTNLDGKSEKIGVELFAEQYFGKLTINETFTYLDTEMKDGPYEGNEIPGVSKYVASLGANYKATDELTLNLTGNYYGRAYASSDYTNDGEKVNDYITVDTKITYDFKNGLKIYGGIDNLFNEKYYDYVGDYNGTGTSRSYYPAAEREYYIGFKYNF